MASDWIVRTQRYAFDATFAIGTDRGRRMTPFLVSGLQRIGREQRRVGPTCCGSAARIHIGIRGLVVNRRIDRS